MALIDKQEADAYDRMLDAAAELADLIEAGNIPVEEDRLEALTIYLASHAAELRRFLGKLKRSWP